MAARRLDRIKSAFRHVPGTRRLQVQTNLVEKWKEALKSVLPITVLVLALCSFWVPLPTDALAAFLFANVLLVIGMGLFNLGTELAMTPIGEAAGHTATRSGKLWVVLVIGFAVGLLVTVAEPDLTVLAAQVGGIPDLGLILSVALGVGVFLALALMRILLRIRMWLILLIAYALVFLLAQFVPQDFLAVAFDSGGVTTGPMTVPFILGLGAGVAAIRSDKDAGSDSFGLVAMASIGPILAVMILAVIYQPDGSSAAAIALMEADHSVLLFQSFLQAAPHYLGDVALALAPVLLAFVVFQATSLHLRGVPLQRILWGLVYTYVGLTFFLIGANVGFMPVGHFLGKAIAASGASWLLVPVGMVIGWFVVSAEPAVQVLSHQVYEMTSGAIPQQALSKALSVGVSVSVGLALWRILAGVPIMTLLIPGYAIAMLLMIFSPPLFTAIAFDSGGVASGPMTATFLLPMALGACQSLGGEAAADAFGVVAMVAMTPLIAIQVLGVVFRLKQRSVKTAPTAEREEIIEL